MTKTESLEVKSLSTDEALQYVEATMKEYVIHNHVAIHQSVEFQRCKSQLRPEDILAIADFGMNYSHRHQDGCQQEYWAAWQTTLLPFVIYRMGKNGKLLLEAYIIYSDDLNHSNKFVHVCALQHSESSEALTDHPRGGKAGSEESHTMV